MSIEGRNQFRNAQDGQPKLEAVEQWTFEPATLEGIPVAVRYILTVNFKLQWLDRALATDWRLRCDGDVGRIAGGVVHDGEVRPNPAVTGCDDNRDQTI